jgi:predicted pyridoxine 5'-phosphate oxidase superfamily flavin-nucleotide-binding protein
MGKIYPILDEVVTQFIQAQPVFFVATAPLDARGHVNVSPKGLDTFRILGPKTLAYLDLTGSGVETVAHVKENSRITLMFCAFAGPPKILRVYGRARVLEPKDKDAEYAALLERFPDFESPRAIVVVDVIRIADSCGYGVPLLRYEENRDQLAAWARNRGPERLKAYRKEKNSHSIDGLPGLSD